MDHVLYMDDLKIYVGIPRQLNQLINIVELYTSNIKMKFGLVKYWTFNIRHGNKELEGFKTWQDIITWKHGIDTYKYLGELQPQQIQHIIIKKQLTTAQTSRLQTILKTHLKSKNLTKAINMCVIPLSTYLFGITSWSQTDLECLELVLRTKMTKASMYHNNPCSRKVFVTKEWWWCRNYLYAKSPW